jgi:hypothetical protein
VIGGASGVIFAVVVIVWVAYVVPLMLRRYDEASKTSSLGSFTSLSRVIPRPGRRDDAEVAEVAEETAEPVEVRASEAPTPAPARTLDRPAARLAAQRRRRVLITLLVTLVVVAGLGVAGVIAQTWTAAPAALLVAWLVACRVQVRGELGLSTPKAPRVRVPKIRAPKSSRSAKATTPARRGGTAADEEITLVVSHQFEDVEPNRPRVMEKEPLGVDALDEQLQIAVPSVSTTGEALWDPLPVTLPTYVTKPRVGRTVRTIDFAQAGTWSSGHVEAEGVALPGRADGSAEPVDGDDQTRRAVGH